MTTAGRIGVGLVVGLVLGLAGAWSWLRGPDIPYEELEARYAGPESAYVDLTGSPEVVIEAVDNTFKPQYATVRVGTPVTFRNDGRSVHNVLPVTEGAFPPIEADAFQPDDEVTVTFDEPGLVPYYCSLHGTTTKGMYGGLRVVG